MNLERKLFSHKTRSCRSLIAWSPLSLLDFGAQSRRPLLDLVFVSLCHSIWKLPLSRSLDIVVIFLLLGLVAASLLVTRSRHRLSVWDDLWFMCVVFSCECWSLWFGIIYPLVIRMCSSIRSTLNLELYCKLWCRIGHWCIKISFLVLVLLNHLVVSNAGQKERTRGILTLSANFGEGEKVSDGSIEKIKFEFPWLRMMPLIWVCLVEHECH